MKKSIVLISVLMVVGVSIFAQKQMTAYGPVTVAVGTTDYLTSGKEVMEFDLVAGTFLATTLGASGKPNKVSGPTTVPVGWVGDGSAMWAFADIGTATIVGFKKKSVFIKYVFTGGPDAGTTRYYSYTLGTTTRPCRVMGSTSNITNANLVQESFDGKSLYIEAAKDGYLAEGIRAQKLTKKLNGYLTKPVNPQKEFATGGATVILPAAKDTYSNTDAAGTITSYK